MKLSTRGRYDVRAEIMELQEAGKASPEIRQKGELRRI